MEDMDIQSISKCITVLVENYTLFQLALNHVSQMAFATQLVAVV